MANKVYLGLGSNKGDRLQFLKEAVNRIDGDNMCDVVKSSSVYETLPYGKKDQPNFLNAVIMIATDYELQALLLFVKQLELEIGRCDAEHWGPREIDIDILLYDDLVYADQNLSVPHIGLTERDFVLKPLIEIDPDITHPAFGLELSEIANSITKSNIIKKHPIDLLNSSEVDLG